MIIAAYADTGKTTFAAQERGALDLPSMPYSWVLPEPGDRSDGELEAEKGALYHFRNPLFPDNYIVEILKAERKYDYVLIPTNNEVVCRLQEEYGRKVLLCYPTDDLKERFDIERMNDRTSPVSMERITEMEQQLRVREKELALYIAGDLGSCIYSIPNLAAPEEKRFLYQIGRKIYGAADLLPTILPSKMLKKENSDRRFWTNNKEKVKAYVDWYVESSKRISAEFEMLR